MCLHIQCVCVCVCVRVSEQVCLCDRELERGHGAEQRGVRPRIQTDIPSVWRAATSVNTTHLYSYIRNTSLL